MNLKKQLEELLPKFQQGGRKRITSSPIAKSTDGSDIAPTDENLIFYGWQSPAVVRGGDADGNNLYYKNNIETYKKLFGELPEKRKGGELKFQKGGAIKPYSQKSYNESDIKLFFNNMINAPWYRQRLIKNDYDKQYNIGVDKVIENRSNRVAETRLTNEQDTGGFWDKVGATVSGKFATNDKLGSFYVEGDNEITLLKSQADATRTHPRSILAHEFGHAETSGGISNTEIDMLVNPIRKGVTDAHDLSPYERKSDIDSIRYNLYKTGQYDPKTGKYKTKTGQFDKTMFEQIKTDGTLKRARSLYEDKDLINIMNTVADNSNTSDVLYAKKGGTLKSQLSILANKFQTRQ